MDIIAVNSRTLKHRAGLGLCALAAVTVMAYALLVVRPLAADNAALRAYAEGLASLSVEVGELGELIASLRRERDEEVSSYQSILRDLRGWRFEVHAYIGAIAVQTNLEVTAMEWAVAEPVTPAFDTDPHQRWLRTEVFIGLAGPWQGHRDFAYQLSRCDCLIQVVEEEMTATARADEVKVSMSLFIYHPGEGARV